MSFPIFSTGSAKAAAVAVAMGFIVIAGFMAF
jgi:hypothetical protein